MAAEELKRDLDEVVRLYNAGAHSTELAARYGVSTSTVLKNLRIRGVQIRPRGGGKKCPPKMSDQQIDELVATLCAEPLLSLDALGERFGVSRATVRRMLIRRDVPRPPPGPRPNPLPERQRRPRTVRQRTVNGYIQVWLPPDDPLAAMCQKRGWVLEHRLVIAREVNRPLLPTETVHHRNGIRDDNRVANLELRQGKHGNGQSFRCAECGSRNLAAI